MSRSKHTLWLHWSSLAPCLKHIWCCGEGFWGQPCIIFRPEAFPTDQELNLASGNLFPEDFLNLIFIVGQLEGLIGGRILSQILLQLGDIKGIMDVNPGRKILQLIRIDTYTG